MPRLPVYDAPESVEGPSVSADVTHAPLPVTSPDLSGIGKGVGEVYDKVQDDARKEEAKGIADADNAYSAHGHDGFENPNYGVATKLGDYAQPAAEEYQKGLAKKRDELMKGLTTDRQKEIFRQHSADMEQSFISRARGYVDVQKKVAQQKTFDDAQKQAIDIVSSNPNDEEGAANQFTRITSLAHAIGLNPDDTRQKLEDTIGKMAAARIEAWMQPGNPDYQSARKFLTDDTVRGALGAKQVEAFSRQIQTAQDQTEGSKDATKIVGQAVTGDDGYLQVDKSKTAVDLLNVPEGTSELKRKVLETEVARRTAELDAAYKQKVTLNYADAHSQFVQGGYRLDSIDSGVLANLLKHDPNGYDHLVEEARKSTAKVARAGKPVPPTLDEQAASATLNKEIQDAPEVWSGKSAIDVTNRAKELGVPDSLTKKALELYSRVKKTGLPANERTVVDTIFTTELKVPSTIAHQTPEQRELLGHVHDYVTQKRAAWLSAPENKGREPNDEQVGKWVREQTLKGEVDGTGRFFRDTVTRAEFETSPKYRGIPENAFHPHGEAASAPAAPQAKPAGSAPTAPPRPPPPSGQVRMRNKNSGKLSVGPRPSDDWLKKHPQWEVSGE